MLLAALFVLALPAASSDAIAVAPFKANGVDAAIGEQVADLLGAELEKFQGVEVITRADLRAVLERSAEAQLLGCDEPTCAVDVARFLPARRLLSGSIGRVADVMVMSAALIDLVDGRVTQRVTQPLGADADAITASLKSAALVLVSADVGLSSGDAVIKGEVTSDLLEQVRRAEKEKGLSIAVIGGAMMSASIVAAGVDPANVGGTGRLDVTLPVFSPWLRAMASIGGGYYTGKVEQREQFLIGENIATSEAATGTHKAEFGISDGFVGLGVAIRRPNGLVLPSAHALVTADVLALDVSDLVFIADKGSPDAPAGFAEPIPFERSIAAGVGFVLGGGVDFLVTEHVGLSASLDVYGKGHGLEKIFEINNVVRRDALAPLFGTTLQVGVVVQL